MCSDAPERPAVAPGVCTLPSTHRGRLGLPGPRGSRGGSTPPPTTTGEEEVQHFSIKINNIVRGIIIICLRGGQGGVLSTLPTTTTAVEKGEHFSIK